MVNNICDYCRGVKVASEKMSCYFGHHVHPTTRTRTVNEMAGNDKASREKGDSLVDKQKELLAMSTAVIICYDNFQRGVSLEDQRCGRSSAYYRGTHQVAHQTIPFTNNIFDAMYIRMTYMDQAIPSPWGMPAYEEFDRANRPSSFLIGMRPQWF